MTQPTQTSSKRKWPWVAGAVGGVVLIAGAVNAGKSAGQQDAQSAPTVVTSAVTQLVPTTVISTSVVTSALTSTASAQPVTVTVTAPASAEVAVAEAPAAPAPVPAAVPSTTTQAPPSQQNQEGTVSGGVSYENCAEAEAAGAAPIMRGEPGYAKKLDRNNDGVACEDS